MQTTVMPEKLEHPGLGEEKTFQPPVGDEEMPEFEPAVDEESDDLEPPPPEDDEVVVPVARPVTRYKAVKEAFGKVGGRGGKIPGAGMPVVYWTNRGFQGTQLIAQPAMLSEPVMMGTQECDGRTWHVLAYTISGMMQQVFNVRYSETPQVGCWSWPQPGVARAELDTGGE